MQAVGDGQHGAVCKLAADGALDELVSLQVHGSRGLIQHEDLGLAQQSPGQAQQLPLPHAAGRKAAVMGA